MAKHDGILHSVVENMPGYMPVSGPAIFTNKKNAHAYAASLARDLRDEEYRVSKISDGCYSAEDRHSSAEYVIETESFHYSDLGFESYEQAVEEIVRGL